QIQNNDVNNYSRKEKQEDTIYQKVNSEVRTIKNGNLKKVNTFPEEYVGNKITFKNIKYWPTLKSFDNYYTVQLGLVNEEEVWCFQTLDDIIGVVKKKIAKQMIEEDIGGYDKYYYGTVEGTVVESDEIFGSDYIFII